MNIGLLELLMGVETPIPPKMITPAAPDGAPPRRLQFPIFLETGLAPPCPVRGPETGSPPINSRYITDFHRMGVNQIGSCLFPMKIGLLELLMGVETPILPKMITPAAPDGAPPRRLQFPIFLETGLAPPCPVRGPEAGSSPINSRYITDFHRMGVNRIGSCLFLQSSNF